MVVTALNFSLNLAYYLRDSLGPSEKFYFKTLRQRDKICHDFQFDLLDKKLVAGGGLEPPTSRLCLLLQLSLRLCMYIEFVVWTFSSPFFLKNLGCLPLSLYTFSHMGTWLGITTA